ncbi:MAG: xanthine dehydrogenase family protein molybdopterin-binding subunit [Janthinobacterium lividum]
MNIAFKPEFEKFAVGQPVSRKEDPVLLRGEGRYSDDINLPGQLHAVFVRSRYAHGVLRSVDTTEAKSMPGVRGVIVAADLEAGGIKPMPAAAAKNADGTPAARPRQMALASTKVRYVGDPIAVVVAETAKQARDAAEAVNVEIDSLPAVTTARAAIAVDAPVLHDEVPGNAFLSYHHGDTVAVDAAFAGAAHVTKLSIRNSRIVVAAMEPRSAVGVFDAESERFTLRLGCQGVFGMRAALKDVIGVEKEKLHILTYNVGGSFGMKASVYPEYPCVLLASKLFGTAVKWTDERSESFLSDSHGRDHETDAELALDASGRFLAVRLHVLGNLGAYLSNATTLPSTANTTKNTIGVYATPLIEVTSTCVFTNTTAVGAYRGAGRPEGNYYMERLIDTAAAEMGIDRVEMRRLNHIRPEQMPFTAPSGMTYDSGDFPALLDRALAMADWDGFAARKIESRSRGKLRGRGIGQYLEVTAPPAPEMGGLRFESDGTVTIITGTLDYGQGHATPFAQLLCDRLGVPFDKVRLLQGDSDQLIAGGGTGGSKSMMASGTAIVAASQLCIEKGRQAAAHVLEAAVGDIEFERGRFAIAGTDRGIGIMELAAELRDAGLPDGVPGSLDVETIDEYSNSAFPNGVHVAEVEVDEETGEVEVVSYNMVNDFGVLINPKLVEGQAHGGVVQGIGQALLEATEYDADGQLMTGSFMDYALPHAVHVPTMAIQSHPVPAKTNVLGVKGCGEAGCAGSLPAVMNALVDALRPVGVTHMDMPATSQKVWAAMQAA